MCSRKIPINHSFGNPQFLGGFPAGKIPALHESFETGNAGRKFFVRHCDCSVKLCLAKLRQTTL